MVKTLDSKSRGMVGSDDSWRACRTVLMGICISYELPGTRLVHLPARAEARTFIPNSLP